MVSNGSSSTVLRCCFVRVSTQGLGSDPNGRCYLPVGSHMDHVVQNRGEVGLKAWENGRLALG